LRLKVLLHAWRNSLTLLGKTLFISSQNTSAEHIYCRYYEDFPLEYPRTSTTHILGVCTGLLAASAVASSRSLTSLLPLAVQTLRIAFRLGSRVATVGHQVESRTSVPQTWSTIVLGISSDDAEIALSEFNENHVSYIIGAEGNTLLMCSGPLTLKSTLHQRC
jgi:Starter unit:ACP transacylase in aflatoxin biosynthesis